jgi:hypothetical protein
MHWRPSEDDAETLLHQHDGVVRRSPPIAVFFVRAWYEDGLLRARVSRTTDAQSEPLADLLTSDPEELIRYLSYWLQEIDQRS